MMPFGRLKELEGGASRQVMARMIEALEGADCEVTRSGVDRLEVLLPGLDSTLWPCESLLPLQRFFWDRMIVRLGDDGAIRYRMAYWSGAQPLLHFAITLVFAAQAWWGKAGAFTPTQFITALAGAHALTALVSFASFGYSINRATSLRAPAR